MDRRAFTRGALATLAAAGAGWPLASALGATRPTRPYRGPNVVIVRFGGGVRRRETIDRAHTYSPFLAHELRQRGTLFTNMRIAPIDGVVTSHGQGTLYILTGRYDRYQDIEGELFGDRFEPKAPTLFEYLRKAYGIPSHRALIVNGEDRTDEEFFTFSNDHHYGVRYRSSVLSLYRYKTYLLRRRIEAWQGGDKELDELQQELAKLEALDYRRAGNGRQVPEIEAFWSRWRAFYGDSGLVNPRGDALLTELAIWALRELQPALLMVNYQDPDYVHWGNPSHYTRGISAIDAGLKQLVTAVESEPAYRGNTVFVVVPDCGRDDNRLMAVPFQHHFNSKAAHEIWALMFGPGIARNTVVDRPVDQIAIAPTVGRLMGFETPGAEGTPLAEAFA